MNDDSIGSKRCVAKRIMQRTYFFKAWLDKGIFNKTPLRLLFYLVHTNPLIGYHRGNLAKEKQGRKQPV